LENKTETLKTKNYIYKWLNKWPWELGI